MNKYHRSLSILTGILLFAFFIVANPFHLDAKAVKVAAVAVLMVSWWVTEAMPMPVVALLPLIMFPIMHVGKMDEVAAPYANPIIFLFLGGFMIGLAIEKWNLHKRIALNIVRITGTSGDRIVLGFIISTAFLSMWLSNTATTMMMFPIAMSVIKVMEETHKNTKGNLRNLSICLLLAIAYAANLGGIATIIGTPPNVAFVAFVEKHNHYSFDFGGWMLICLPIAMLLLFCLYIVMVKILYPNRIPADKAAKEMILLEIAKLGKLSKPEKRVLFVFILTALLWILRTPLNNATFQSWILSVITGKQALHETFFKLDDTMIAISGAVMLFILRSQGTEQESRYILEWDDTHKMAWGILLLFGGGITLATQLENAGLIQLLGQWIATYSTGGFWLVFIVAIVSIFISEVMSNIAQVIVFAPVIAGISEALHMNPLILGLAMTLGASVAGMLPMGTPPNAIVFASGKLKLKHMLTTGLIMNLIAAILISVFCWYLLPVFVKPLT